MPKVLRVPEGKGAVPGVVIVHEYWGVNEQITDIAQQWADEGFLAVVPDLYDGKVAKTAEEAGAMMKALDFGAAVGKLGAAVAELKAHPRSNGKVALTGYCLGGALTFAGAVNIRGLSAVVPFYGLPGDLDWSKIDAPVQAHFAKRDDWATVAGAEKIKAAVKVPMELHVYDAGHAFCNARRPEAYNADACKTAWGRTVAFIRSHTT